MGTEPFTKRDLGDQMKSMGFAFAANTSLQAVMKKLIELHVIEQVRQGGGGQPNLYRQIVSAAMPPRPEEIDIRRDEQNDPKRACCEPSTPKERWPPCELDCRGHCAH